MLLKISEINPFIRFAECTNYNTYCNPVNVFDSRIFYITSGALSISISEKCFSLSKGSLFYCCAGSNYSLKGTKDCQLIILNFDLSQRRNGIKSSVSPQLISDVDPKNLYSNCDPIEETGIFESLNSYLTVNNLDFGDILNSIIAEHSYKNILYRERASALLKELLIDICRTLNIATSKSSDLIKSIILYIRNHSNEKISNESIGKKYGYHPYYINKIFLKQTGKTIHKYILTVRLENAKRQLINTDKPINRIAEETGFYSASHMTNSFKSHFHSSPLEFRKNNKGII